MALHTLRRTFTSPLDPYRINTPIISEAKVPVNEIADQPNQTFPRQIFDAALEHVKSESCDPLLFEDALSEEEIDEFLKALQTHTDFLSNLDIKKKLPEAVEKTAAYQKVAHLAAAVSQSDRRRYPVVRITDCNPNRAYRFHHDRSNLTILCMMREPEAGGEFCYIPTGGRAIKKKFFSIIARFFTILKRPHWFEALFAQKILLKKRQMLFMKGSRVLHYNVPVKGNRNRIVYIWHVDDNWENGEALPY